MGREPAGHGAAIVVVGLAPHQGAGHTGPRGEGRQVTRGLSPREGRTRRSAETLRRIRRQRGPRGLPVTAAYRLRSQRDLDLRAYGQRYRHKGAMRPGGTPDPVDGMSRAKLETILHAWRQAR